MSSHIQEDDQYFDEEDENDDDCGDPIDDDEYWSTDELGIDPEDLYDAAATI